MPPVLHTERQALGIVSPFVSHFMSTGFSEPCRRSEYPAKQTEVQYNRKEYNSPKLTLEMPSRRDPFNCTDGGGGGGGGGQVRERKYGFFSRLSL